MSPAQTQGRQDALFHGQGRSQFGARSILPVREHGKRARTPQADFFNIPGKENTMRPYSHESHTKGATS
ncbi:MAG: hypothetical protein VST68_04385 [Nitrospirota bacterium]|nr:hypothetical protein [Nitrospirota bacterium]